MSKHTFTFTPYDRKVTFHLQRKPAKLGAVDIDHWWMPIPTIYPLGTSKLPINSHAAVDSFWQLCRQAGSDRDEPVAESYLLAKLLPHMRSYGARRIVADARLDSRSSRFEEARLELEAILQCDPLHPITEKEFRLETKKAIGPFASGSVKMTDTQRRRYAQIRMELFEKPLLLLPRDANAAFEKLRRTWTGWTKGFARRRGREEDKLILDVFSYEARAALHRCLSAAWTALILPRLVEQHAISKATIAFLSFWHLEPTRASRNPNVSSHLFHAGTFATHPAGASFIGTTDGQALLGQWLESVLRKQKRKRKKNEPPFEHSDAYRGREYGRLLRGILLAVYDYAVRRLTANEDRRGSAPRPSLLSIR